MKKLLKTLALGTTALALVLITAPAFPEGETDTSGWVTGKEAFLEALPKTRNYNDILNLRPSFNGSGGNEDSGPVPVEYVRIADTYGSGYYYIPGTETVLKIGGRVRYDTPAITYDSNICQFYNSGRFYVPNNDYYDPRFLDEAAWYVDQLDDEEFEDYVDWLDGGPRPFAFRGSALWRAMEITYWMTPEEYYDFEDWVYDQDDQFHHQKDLIRLLNSGRPIFGLFNDALGVPLSTRILDISPDSLKALEANFGGFDFREPRLQISGRIEPEQIRRFGESLENSGGGLVENGTDQPEIAIPYKFAYNLDRFKIYADFQYGLENNITDGSVPTLQYEGKENPFNNYLNNFINDPKGQNWTIDPRMLNMSLGYAYYDFGDETPPTTTLGPGALAVQQQGNEEFEWEDISPRVGLSYDLGYGASLRIPYGKYTKTETPVETTEETTENNFYTQPTYAGIQFKVEENVGQGDQSNLRPAQETVVKLNFAPPPLPIEGNPKIDDGASEDPIQGEVDAATGRIKFDYKWRTDGRLSVGAEYNWDGGFNDAGNGTEGADDEEEGYQVDPRLLKVKLQWDTGGMVQIDPPSLKLEAGPAPVDSVVDDLQPYSLADQPQTTDTQPSNQGTPSETPDRPTRTDVNWADVQNALGEYADLNRLNQMVEQSTEPNNSNPGTSSTTTPNATTGAGTNSFTPQTTTDSGITFSNTPTGMFSQPNVPVGDKIEYITPRFSGFDIGVRDYPSTPQVEIQKTPINSRNVFSTDPDYSLGGMEQYLRRSFSIDGVRVDSLFFPRTEEETVKTALDNNPSIDDHEKNPYRDKQGQDPYFKSQGTWGQDYDDQWAIKHVGFTEEQRSAWVAAGHDLKEVIVAVIDTGIDWNHADLSWDTIWRNKGELPDNGVDDDGNGYVDDLVGWDFFLYNNLPWDEDGHGTFVAGLIAAISDNNTGISGINPNAKIMVLKALDSFGHTRANYLAEAIVYAVDNGANVINLSVGGDELSHAEDLAIQYAEKKGVVVFAAAGNKAKDASDFGFAPYETVVTVGSSTREDARSGFSNFGEQIDIVAPGEDVLSLRARRTDLMLNVRHLEYELGANYVGDDKRYYRAAGTSFATPIVAGVASLILAKNPNLTPAEVRRMILQTAKDVDVPGRDHQTGFGLLDAAAAISADPDFEITADIVGVEVIQDGGVFVAVTGSADANEFDKAQLYIGQGENPDSWKAVGPGIKKAVQNGRLDLIPAGELQGAPLWIIRLVVTHKDGQTREERFVLNLG